MAQSTAVNGSDYAGSQRDEETPLLADQLKPTSGGNDVRTTNESSEEQVVLIEDISSKKLTLILGSIYVGVFLGALDATIIATLANPISSSFSSQNLLSWVASAYLIANAACQPLSGRLTDIFGRGNGLLFSNIFFATGNLICGLAQQQWVMIFGRVIAGIGGGGLMAISTFVASDLVPLRKRGFIQGLGNICYGTGAGLGGVFGGWVNDVWGWRVAFLAQVPLVIMSAILIWFAVDIPPKESSKSKISRIDFTGAGMLIVTLVLLLLGLNSGGNIVSWTSPLVLVSLPLSMVALGAFIYVEAYRAKEPIIPVKLLLNQTVAAACLTNWFSTMVIFMLLFYGPIYFQVQGFNTTQAGIRLIPQSIGTSLASLGSGLIMKWTGKYRILGIVLASFLVTGTALFAAWVGDIYKPNRPIYFFLTLAGMGYGGMLTVTLLAVIAAVDHDQQAVVTSATYAFRSTGSTIGITIASAAYQNILKTRLWQKFGDREGAAEIIESIRDNFSEIQHLPEGWKEGVLDSYMDSLKGVFLTATGVAVLALCCQAFIRQHTLYSNLARRPSR